MPEYGGAQVALLDDGDASPRLHLQHGPIDLIVQADGADQHVRAAFTEAAVYFETILENLVTELPRLREPLSCDRPAPELNDPIARRMLDAASAFAADASFITPMIAVAGSVADAVLDRLLQHPLDRCFVNNGGDIALFTAPGCTLDVGIVDCLDGSPPVAQARFGMTDRALRLGVATSGWRGRSHSFGIADAVTAIADTAATADVAATLVANAVTVDHPAVRRERADLIDSQSDLGARLVTTECGPLDFPATQSALNSGVDVAKRFVDRGLSPGIAVFLQGLSRFVGDLNIPGYDIPAQSTHPAVFEASNER